MNGGTMTAIQVRPEVTHGIAARHLRLAIATAIVDRIDLDTITDRLFREDHGKIGDLYHEITRNRLDFQDEGRSRPTKNDDIKAPVLTREKVGMSVTDIAKGQSMNRETLVSLMEHHGYLELVPYGHGKRKYLVTDTAFHAAVGHNVQPGNRIARLEGYAEATPFPVFYPDTLNKVLWTLDYDGIKDAVSGAVGKKAKLSWLLSNHGYLPDAEIAALSDYSRRGVNKARCLQSDTQAA
jgi:hypothetical protein